MWYIKHIQVAIQDYTICDILSIQNTFKYMSIKHSRSYMYGYKYLYVEDK